MNKNLNDWLAFGIFLLIIGLILLVYSVCTYVEVKSLGEKVDFELIDDNADLSYSDKYYRYLSIADFLNQKLDKNKGLPIKNTSCIYLDYAQHNAIELYELTNKNATPDTSKQNTAAGNIRSLYSRLDNYNTCKKTPLYKSELQKLITEIEKKNNAQEKMNDFLNK